MKIRIKWKFIIPFIEVLIISCVLVIGISINRGIMYENGLRMAQYTPGISGIGLSEMYKYSSINKSTLLSDELIDRVRRDGNTVTLSVHYKKALNLGTTYNSSEYENMDFSYLDNVELLGTYAEYFNLFKPSLIAGRYFTEDEHEKMVCVIGEGTAIKVFGTAEDSIGKRIKVARLFQKGEDEFEIVGVIDGGLDLTVKTVEATGNGIESLYVAADEMIIYPLPLLHYNDATFGVFKSIWIKGDKNDAEKLVGELKKDNGSTDFVINPKPHKVLGNSETEKLVLSAVNIFMLLMLVVAGLNIIGIQLILINRRREEFGLNMAVGACRRDIFMQVLLEAFKLILVPTIIGLIIGFASLPFVSDLISLTLIADVNLILSSIGIMGMFIIMTGTYPAIKGADIDPVVAMGRTPGFN